MELHVVVRPELEVRDEAFAHAADQVVAHRHLVGHQDRLLFHPRIAALHVVRVELAVGVAGRQHDAEALVEDVAPAHAPAPRILAAQVVVAVVGGRREEAAVRIVEDARRDEVDRAADRVAVQVRRRRT